MGFSWSFGLTNSVQPNSLAVKNKSKKKMQSKFNIKWIKKTTRPYFMNTYDRPHSANPK